MKQTTKSAATIGIACLMLFDLTISAARATDLSELGQIPDRGSLPSCSEINIGEASFNSDLDTYCISDMVSGFFSGVKPSVNVVGNDTWSGYAVESATGANRYIEIKGRFTTPPLSTTCLNPDWGVWIGLGGIYSDATGNQRLIQMGISNYVDTSGRKSYILWIEWLNSSNPLSALFIPTRMFGPGENITMSVTYDVATKRASFYMINNTKGGTPYFSTTSSDLSSFYDGSTAEWINEEVNPGVSPIYNFGSLRWTEAQVKLSNTSWVDLGSESGFMLKIVDSLGRTVASPQNSPVNLTSFTDTFYRCG